MKFEHFPEGKKQLVTSFPKTPTADFAKIFYGKNVDQLLSSVHCSDLCSMLMKKGMNKETITKLLKAQIKKNLPIYGERSVDIALSTINACYEDLISQ